VIDFGTLLSIMSTISIAISPCGISLLRESGEGRQRLRYLGRSRLLGLSRLRCPASMVRSWQLPYRSMALKGKLNGAPGIDMSQYCLVKLILKDTPPEAHGMTILDNQADLLRASIPHTTYGKHTGGPVNQKLPNNLRERGRCKDTGMLHA